MTPKRLKPPTVWWLSFLGPLAVHALFSFDRVLPPASLWVGGLVLALGIALMMWAIKEFERHETTHKVFGDAAKLVTSGPFAWSRNPMYLGMTAALLGLAVFVGSVPMFAAPLVFWTTIQLIFVPYEERKLSESLGTEYLEYRQRVRRWI